MITWEDIRRVTEEATVTPIKDKPYITVAERIKAFRKLYPDGFIKTEMISNIDGVCVFRAFVGYYKEDGTAVVLGTGTAYEKESSSFINKTSYIEVAESSSIGRAIGMTGIGIASDVASAEEVMNAEINNIEKQTIDEVKVKALTERCKNFNVNIQNLCKLYKVKRLEDLTEKKFANIHEHWDLIVMGKESNK